MWCGRDRCFDRCLRIASQLSYLQLAQYRRHWHRCLERKRGCDCAHYGLAVVQSGAGVMQRMLECDRLTSVSSAPQALVFCNSRGWAEALADRLCERGFPTAFTCGQFLLICWPAQVEAWLVLTHFAVSGSLLQKRRMEIIDAVRSYFSLAYAPF